MTNNDIDQATRAADLAYELCQVAGMGQETASAAYTATVEAHRAGTEREARLRSRVVPEVAQEIRFANPANDTEAAVIERWNKELSQMTADEIMAMEPRQFAIAFYGPCVTCDLHECDVLTRARCESSGKYPL